MVLAVPAGADNWPQFRGPTGQGQTKDTNLPLKWSDTENVKWKIKLPDEGNSTPVIWGNKVFITQASDKVWPPKPPSGGPAVAKKRSLMCLDRANGKTLWEKTVTYEEQEVTHGTNPFCSASPATDGERVVVSHGTPGLFCYDLDGKELWKRTDLGKQEHIWGNASSPVIIGDLVFFVVGPGENTALYAFDKKTGTEVWKVTEPGGKAGFPKGEAWIGSWSTPIVVKVGDREELIMSWPGVVRAYDPKKGTELWSCQGLAKDKGTDRLVYTSPVATDQVVVAAAGFGGPALAVKPGGKGDVTETHRLWRHANAPQRIGSGVIIGDHFYLVNEPGTFICMEWRTGKTLFT
jgi:outer membrane protein assembly factor BamB